MFASLPWLWDSCIGSSFVGSVLWAGFRNYYIYALAWPGHDERTPIELFCGGLLYVVILVVCALEDEGTPCRMRFSRTPPETSCLLSMARI